MRARSVATDACVQTFRARRGAQRGACASALVELPGTAVRCDAMRFPAPISSPLPSSPLLSSPLLSSPLLPSPLPCSALFHDTHETRSQTHVKCPNKNSQRNAARGKLRRASERDRHGQVLGEQQRKEKDQEAVPPVENVAQVDAAATSHRRWRTLLGEAQAESRVLGEHKLDRADLAWVGLNLGRTGSLQAFRHFGTRSL